jgi:hypothetical protein
MFLSLKVVTVFLVSIVMSMSLAHALELPGKLRLDKQGYLTVQPIYYPGFTIGGMAEGLGILATLALLIATPSGFARSLVLVAFIALVAMHAVYWIVTHPVNNFWLKDTGLQGVGAGFFAFGSGKSEASAGAQAENAWKGLRNRWEISHIIRGLLAAIALIALIIAVAI